MPITILVRQRTLWTLAATALALIAMSSTATAGPGVPKGPSLTGSHSVYHSGTPRSVSQSIRLLANNHYQRAASRADRALREHLTRGQREMMLHTGCVARLALRDHESARPYCTAAVRIDGPRHGLHLVNRGSVRLLSGDRRRAIEDYEAAIAWFRKRGIEEALVARVEAHLEGARATASLGERASSGLASGRPIPGHHE